MKIAFIGTRGVPAKYGGFETAAEEICSRLVQSGHEVTVYCRKGYGITEEKKYKGITKKFVPHIHISFLDTLSHTFFSFLDTLIQKPDVILVMSPVSGPLCVIPRLRGIPFAINVDGLEWKRSKWPLVGRIYLYFASWFCTKIAPAIIADSLGIKNIYKQKWKRDSVFISYGAYIESSTQPEILSSYNIKPDDYFLIVARLEPENNILLIVNAFKRVKTEKKLIIIGGTKYKSNYLDKLKLFCKDDKRIILLGPIYDQTHLKELICNSFAYVHGHMVGGTNPILLKALGCQQCVLYLNVAFNREVVENAGIPFDEKGSNLHIIMQQLIENPEQVLKYRQKGPERIISNYTWDKVAEKYEKLCLELMKNG